MPETCVNGHVRTEENTTFVKDSSRNRMKKRCLDCRRWPFRTADIKGGVPPKELKAQGRRERIEDIEDLIRFGATFAEIVERCAYANWERLSAALREAGRQDLLETLRMKRKGS